MAASGSGLARSLHPDSVYCGHGKAEARQIAERHAPAILGRLLTDSLNDSLPPDLDEFTRARIRRDVLRRLKPHVRQTIDRVVEQVVATLEPDD